MTRRSARIKNLNPHCIEVESTVQEPEVTNSDHINLKVCKVNLQIKRKLRSIRLNSFRTILNELSCLQVQDNNSVIEQEDINIQKEDVESSECESEAPEEVPFEKSKAMFMEESSVIRYVIRFVLLHISYGILYELKLSDDELQ